MSCDNPSGDADALMHRRLKYDRSKTCVKCKQNIGNIVIRHAVYCRDCFVPLVTFRFRRALEPHINAKPDGPRRTALKPTGNLLVAFSGGLGSTVLLDLINRCYVNPDESIVSVEGGRDHPRHERVWKKVTVCYVELCGAFPEMKDRTDEIRDTVSLCQGIEFLPLRIQDAFDPSWWKNVGVQPDVPSLYVNLHDDRLPFTLSSDQNTQDEPIPTLRRYLASLPTPTALDSTVKMLIRVLLQYAALMTGASHLIFGTTLTSLAVSLISSVSHGGGFHIKEEAQEEWFPDVPVVAELSLEKRPTPKRSVRLLHPLKDVGRKECGAWSWWMGSKVVGREGWQRPGAKSGIDRLTKDFILGLEKDYPSTVSTIVRTCAKLAPKGEQAGYCISCQRPIQFGVQDWKQRISIRSHHDTTAGTTEQTFASNIGHLSRYLCYACHTDLTSKSSRPTPSLYSNAERYDMVVPPVWTRSRIGSILAATVPAIHGETPPEPLTQAQMREVVRDYLLDD